MSNNTALQVILFVYTDSSCFCRGWKEQNVA
jgi:hypothetical protein